MNAISKENLIAKIRLAFQGVTLGNGIGLHEAQAIDDYEPEKQEDYRSKDEKVHWEKIHRDILLKYSSSLSFFDAEGMRFHLPAYLLAELDEFHVGIFHLINLNDWMQTKYMLLSTSQKQAVCDFLRYCAAEQEYEYERPAIEMAINDYWGIF